MPQPAPAIQPLELDCADESIAREIVHWLAHLRAERRLSPKTLEAYARDSLNLGGSGSVFDGHVLDRKRPGHRTASSSTAVS